MKFLIAICILFILVPLNSFGLKPIKGDTIAAFMLEEVKVYAQYTFESTKEKIEYQKIESDIRKVYPLVKLITTEYKRVNNEMELYDKKRQREYLKWYENYAREKYMPYMSDLTIPQGKMLLKLIDRELNETPYSLIKRYRNGFRAVVWQGAAFVFTANLKSGYDANENPMVEHILMRIKSEEPLSDQETKSKF